jgi:hypothetical protein
MFERFRNRSDAVEANLSVTSCLRNSPGPTNTALALINFSNLDAYEKYREAFAADAAAIASVAAVEKTGCILCEDRSFLRQIV